MRNYRATHPDYRKHGNLQSKNWRKKNPKQTKFLKLRSQAKRYEELRKEAMVHYSDGPLKCAKCGFSNIDALELDHVNGDGAKDRAINPAGYAYYRLLKKNNYLIQLQVLCHNCHVIKSRREKRVRLGLPVRLEDF